MIIQRLHRSFCLGLPCRILKYKPQKGTTMEPMGRYQTKMIRYLDDDDSETLISPLRRDYLKTSLVYPPRIVHPLP